MTTYLSVDLDFWTNHQSDRGMCRFVDRCLSLGMPTMLVGEHHWLIDHVNQHRADKLVNVDYHDDIVDRSPPLIPLNDGSWVSHVRWRRRSHYEWRYPHRKWLWHGLCGSEDIYASSPSPSGWGRATWRHGLLDIGWEEVIAVGIAISPAYSFEELRGLDERRFSWLEAAASGKHPLRHYKSLMRRLLQLDCTDPLVTQSGRCSDEELVQLSFSEVHRHLQVT